MKDRLFKTKTLLIAAGSVLALGTALAVVKKVAGKDEPPTKQFALFRNLQPGEDPLDVAKEYMGPDVVQDSGFFSVDFKLLDNPNVVGMLL